MLLAKEMRGRDKRDALRYRIAPLEMTPGEFRKVGHQLAVFTEFEPSLRSGCNVVDRTDTIEE
jgi:hypothetical protein